MATCLTSKEISDIRIRADRESEQKYFDDTTGRLKAQYGSLLGYQTAYRSLALNEAQRAKAAAGERKARR
jgi:hypothetical protein